MLSSLIAPSLVSKDLFRETLGNAFNDPLSNIVFLGSSVSRTDALQSFQNGAYPIQCLEPFLHEGTHHRCFDSPVGYALLGIEGFSRASWWKAIECRGPKGTKNECSQNPTCFNRALIRALYHLLTPLAEGLALFGELDATPGTSPAASTLTLNTIPVFFYKEMLTIHHQGGGMQAVFDDYRKWLADARTQKGSSFLRTREALVQQSSDSTNAYKVGFDWISHMVGELHKSAPATREDSDVTLAFLCSFFFDDGELATTIADSSWNLISGKPTRTLKDIARRLEMRAQELHGRGVAKFFDEYTARLVTGDSRRCSFLHYSASCHEHLKMFSAQAAATELKWDAPKTSKHRHILRFAAMKADKLVLDTQQGTFKCIVEGMEISGPALTKGFPLGSNQTTLIAENTDTAVELMLVQHQPLACFFYKGNLIAATDRQFDPIPEEIAEQILGDLSPFPNAEYWRRHYWELLDPDPNTTCGAYLNNRLQEANGLAQCLYAYT